MGSQRFNLVTILPHPRLHGLKGYGEVIETIEWGLTELGHDCRRTTNEIDPERTNVLFGAQMLPSEFFRANPARYVAYNLEQIANVPLVELGTRLRPIVEHCEIWDYSAAQVQIWKKLGAKAPVQVLPAGYAPILTRIPRREPDIDVLFYGLPSRERLVTFEALCMMGLKCVFVCGLYGPERDELISRAKVVLNINQYVQSRVFEVVRVSYLLANRKAVVADRNSGTVVPDGWGAGVRFASLQDVPRCCLELVEDDAQRHQLEEEGFEAVKRLDIRDHLRTIGM